MVGKTSIRINKSTLELLQILKIQKNKISYDDVLNEVLLKYNMHQEPEKISNKDLLISTVKSDKQILKRLEALHDRFGYYEKVYFTKIVDIADDIEAIILQKEDEENVKKEVKIDNNSLQSKELLNLKKRHIELETDHEKLQKISVNSINKIKKLKSKVSKKTSLFASGYDLNLTEEEYNSIFN